MPDDDRDVVALRDPHEFSRAFAHFCDTLPAVLVLLGWIIVWIESTMTNSGLIRSIVFRIASISVSG